MTFKDILSEDKIRGEFVCIVEGAKETVPVLDDGVWMDEVLMMCKAGESTKNVANFALDKVLYPKQNKTVHS